MNDIVDKLISVGKDYDFHSNSIVYEAVEEITKLREEVERLRGEVDEIAAARHMQREHNRLLVELATTQLENHELRDVLGECEAMFDPEFGSSELNRRLTITDISAILSKNYDDSALREHVANAIIEAGVLLNKRELLWDYADRYTKGLV